MSAPTRSSNILRVLRLIEGVATAERPLSVTELNERLGLPKATAHRLCARLEAEGYLQRKLDGRRLIPGPRLRRMALGVLASEQFRAERHAILMRLSERIGETCNISVPAGSEMIYFDRVETHWPLRLQLPVGTRVPLHCTAAGKLYLASLAPDRRRALVASLTLERRAARTLTSREALERALEVIAEERIGSDHEEFLDGMVAVSVPIESPSGSLVAALAVHAPTSRMSLAELRAQVPAMRRAARALARLVEEE